MKHKYKKVILEKKEQPADMIKKDEQLWWYKRPITLFQLTPWIYEIPNLNFLKNKAQQHEQCKN